MELKEILINLDYKRLHKDLKGWTDYIPLTLIQCADEDYFQKWSKEASRKYKQTRQGISGDTNNYLLKDITDWIEENPQFEYILNNEVNGMAKNKLPRKEDLPRKTLKEILQQLNVEDKQINRLSKPVQETVFIDNYVKKEPESEDILKLTNHSIMTGEENYLYINFKDSTLEYHDILNGINRIRRYTKGGIDLSLLMQL